MLTPFSEPITGMSTASLMLRYLLEVPVRPHGIVFHAREIGQRLGEGLRRVLGMGELGQLLVCYLLLEQRVHDDGSGAGVFQAAHQPRSSTSGDAPGITGFFRGRPR